MKIESDLVKLLMEIGFLAGRSGRLREAGLIFNGVAKARPNSAYPRIGLGYVAMACGQFAKATEILRSAPAGEREESELCQGFLGMALQLDGQQHEAREILTQLQDEGKNEVAVLMAGNLLEKL
jgi:Flp pilus assembly protein TadD